MNLAFVKRHLFSLCTVPISFLAIYGWHQSSKTWTAYNAITPIGTFKFLSESSMFLAGANFGQSRNELQYWRSVTPVYRDQIRFINARPSAKIHGSAISIYAPYWQLIFGLYTVGGCLFWLENWRTRRKISEK